MSGVQGRTPDEFTVYNVMLPRVYNAKQRGNLFERRAKVRGARCQVPGKLPTEQPAPWHAAAHSAAGRGGHTQQLGCRPRQ